MIFSSIYIISMLSKQEVYNFIQIDLGWKRSHMNVKCVVTKIKEYSLVIEPQKIMKTFNCGAILFFNQNWHWPPERFALYYAVL